MRWYGLFAEGAPYFSDLVAYSQDKYEPARNPVVGQFDRRRGISTDWRQTSQVKSQDVRRRNQAQFSGQDFGTGRERDPGAEWWAFAMFFGTEF